MSYQSACRWVCSLALIAALGAKEADSLADLAAPPPPAKPTKPAPQPSAKQTSPKPAAKSTTKPAGKPLAKPAAKPSLKPATRPSVAPNVKAAAKPATRPVAKATTRPATQPTTKPAPVTIAPSPSAPTYAIKLTRPAQVGDKYRYVADATLLHSMTATISGRTRTLRPSSASLRFEALEHILAVNAHGEPSKAVYTIEKCIKREGKHETVLIQPGRQLTVTAGRWKSRIEPEEGPLRAQDEIALRAVVSLPNLNDVNLDDCFGTTKPQKVGGTWRVNPEALARLCSREGVRVKKEHVSGTVKLREMQMVNGVPHLLIQGKATVEHWTPDAADLSEGVRFVEGTQEIKFTRLVPVDPSGHCLVESGSAKALMKVVTDDAVIGPDVLVDAKVLRTAGIKRTPVRENPIASGAE